MYAEFVASLVRECAAKQVVEKLATGVRDGVRASTLVLVQIFHTVEDWKVRDRGRSTQSGCSRSAQPSSAPPSTAAARLQAAGAEGRPRRAAMAAAAAAALETGIDAAAAATQAAEMIGVLGLLQHEAGGADGAAGSR